MLLQRDTEADASAEPALRLDLLQVHLTQQQLRGMELGRLANIWKVSGSRDPCLCMLSKHIKPAASWPAAALVHVVMCTSISLSFLSTSALAGGHRRVACLPGRS